MKYQVLKRVVNNYRVEVEADSPEAAIRAACKNDHSPGELDSSEEDGENYRPHEWRVYGLGGPSYGYSEINFGIDRDGLSAELL